MIEFKAIFKDYDFLTIMVTFLRLKLSVFERSKWRLFNISVGLIKISADIFIIKLRLSKIKLKIDATFEDQVFTFQYKGDFSEIYDDLILLFQPLPTTHTPTP